MDTITQIETFKTFFEENYKLEILEAIRKRQAYIWIDFKELAKFDPDLATLILDLPEEIIKAAEIALEGFGLPATMKNMKARFENLPESQEIMINEIRSEHFDKFFRFQCVVRRQSDVRAHIFSARFECPSCGCVISTLQISKEFKEPTRCGCSHKGKFNKLSKEFIDAQSLVIAEIPEDLIGEQQPKQLCVFLTQDLTDKENVTKTLPGKQLIINGIIKEVPIELKKGGISVKLDYVLDANSFESCEESEADIEISAEDEKEIKEFTKQKGFMKRLIDMMAPSIYGCNPQKESIIHVLAGGNKDLRQDGTTIRGDMHMFLAGEPGLAKSQLLKRSCLIAPKARYVSGKGSSGVGLTASVMKDEILGGWALEAGAMVLAHKGFLMIDEIDKMSSEDRSAMHEGLEQQTVTVNKANIHATLKCETTVIAAGNPKDGVFNPYEVNFAKQLEITSTLLNRFDIIFKIQDNVDPKRDENLVDHIFSQGEEFEKEKKDYTLFLKKYLSYARKLKPKWEDEAKTLIKTWYVKARNNKVPDSLPINPRQLNAVKRLAEANAKLHITESVNLFNAKEAIRIIGKSLIQIGCLSKETGQYKMDCLIGGDYELRIVESIIMKEKIQPIPIKNIIQEAIEKGIKEEIAWKKINKLKESGSVFEPKSGYIMKS